MTTYVQDEDGNTVTEECMYLMCGNCFSDECQCQCHPDVDPQRARDLDNRDPDKLHVVAADMEREQYGNPRDLTAERFGPVDHEMPARDYPQQPVDALTSRDARIIAKNHSPYTGRPTTTDDVIRRYAHRLSTGPLAWPDLPGNAGGSDHGGHK